MCIKPEMTMEERIIWTKIELGRMKMFLFVIPFISVVGAIVALIFCEEKVFALAIFLAPFVPFLPFLLVYFIVKFQLKMFIKYNKKHGKERCDEEEGGEEEDEE